MKFGAFVLGALAMAVASPAMAQGQVAGGSKAIWLALGVVFLGAFLALFGSLLAITGNARAKSDRSLKD